MKIVDVDINLLTPAEYNPRDMTKKERADLDASLDEFGMVEPIVANNHPDRMNVIIGGHQRLISWKARGNKTIPVNYVSLPIGQERELNLRLNRNNGHFVWDMMKDFDEDMLKKVGFSNEELDEIFEKIKEDTVEYLDDSEVVSKKGEIYALGEHRLMCGDSTKIEDVEKLMGKQRIKTLFTSPPYNMNRGMYENYTDDLKSQEYIDFNINTALIWKEYLDGYMFWNLSYNKNARWEFLEIMYRLIKETGLRFLEMIVWDKGHGMPITSKDMLTREYEDILLIGEEAQIQKDIDLLYVGTKYNRAIFFKSEFTGTTNYWRIVPNKVQRADHLAIYPVEVPARGIIMTTAVGDIVADPFGGTGSTLMACEQLDRICYMMEIDPKFCDVIRRRYAESIGKGKQWQTITKKI